MRTALAAPDASPATRRESLPERMHVLESRPGVRQILLVTEGRGAANERQAVIVLGAGGGGFAVTSIDGVPQIHGGLPQAHRQRLANAIGGAVIAVSPPTDYPVMDRAWRLSDDHVADMQMAVNWTKSQWPDARTWMLGLNSGALSAAFATASIDDLSGAVLLSCADEALEQPQKTDRMRVLAIRHWPGDSPAYATLAHSRGRKTLVTLHDERQARDVLSAGGTLHARQFGGKERQVVDVVARWILTGAAPDEIR